MKRISAVAGGMPPKSLDASGGSVFLNLLGAAKGALIRAAASTQPLCVFYAPTKMTDQERAAEFIIFAIKQANDAQAFGFTRNECCRNLKTAIHQYWQNKILGHHGQAHKARIPRSKAALNYPDSECVVEHVM